MSDILVIGSFVIGVTVRLPRMPVPGETLVADLFDLGVGGKGTNLAVAAARQGKQVAIVARVGDDDFATMAYDLYAAEGIDGAGVMRTPCEKTAIGLYRGANWRLTPADIAPHIARHRSARVLATQLEIPDETVVAAVQLPSFPRSAWECRPGAPRRFTLSPVTQLRPDLPKSRPHRRQGRLQVRNA